MKKRAFYYPIILLVATLICCPGIKSFAQEKNNSSSKTAEVKFYPREMYDYYLKKNPNVIPGTFVDESGVKYLVVPELEGLKNAISNLKIEELLNKNEANKHIVYVSTFNQAHYNRAAPYFISYDDKGRILIKE